ncbi:MAG: hypothetical protein ABEL51_11690 [Salinibacter sp.]
MTHAPNWGWSGDGAFGGPILLVVFGGLLLGIVGADPASAQSTDDGDEEGLLERYLEARHEALARRYLKQKGRFPVLPPQPLPTPTDSLIPAAERAASATENAFPLHDVRPVRQMERGWFQERFAGTEWAFLGETPGPTFLDTTRTLDLRGRLQAQFGDPTRTVADRPLTKPPDHRTQFEYWFVVNDSIPVQIMDPMGPKGRGLIVATERPLREQLRALRDTLLAPLRRSKRAPYADYYYDNRRERWYRTGYDGQSFFLEQIPGTAVVPGQRARLDTTHTPGPASPTDENSP